MYWSESLTTKAFQIITMSLVIFKKSQTISQFEADAKELVSQMKIMGSNLHELTSLLNMVTFMISKHQYDRLVFLRRDHLIVQHNLMTRMQLIRLGLYDSIGINGPFDISIFLVEFEALENRLEKLKINLFSRTKSSLLL